jgi:hypothetical protein
MKLIIGLILKLTRLLNLEVNKELSIKEYGPDDFKKVLTKRFL